MIAVRTAAVLVVGTLAWLAFVGWHRRRTALFDMGLELSRDPRAFGQAASGSSVAGLDGPMIGAPSMVLVDGLVERESGQTPPPPGVSVKGLAIALLAMFLFGILGAMLAHWLHIPLVVGPRG